MLNADSHRIATILAAAPAWAKLGLMDRDSRMRETATETLAAIVADRLTQPELTTDDRQLPLL